MKAILYFTLICLSVACTKVIQVDVETSSSQLVIQANVTDSAAPWRVMINKSVNVGDLNSFPPVSGASVVISDSTSGLRYSLSEISPGLYSTPTPLQGTSGHFYTLRAVVVGQSYAATAFLPPAVPLDSVSFRSISRNPTKSQLNAVANFQDPAGQPNYYTLAQLINGQPIDALDFTLSDRLSDGKYIVQTLFTDSSLIKTGDLVTVKLRSVDKDVWNYFSTLQSASGSASFRGLAPANPVTNITGGALGYFAASAVRVKSATAR